MLVRLGFVQGDSSANVFFHAQRRIAVSVHGDDFTACGPADSLDWYEKAVSAEYDISVGPRLGPAPEETHRRARPHRSERSRDTGRQTRVSGIYARRSSGTRNGHSI
jgi:hypothetical protein